jgi:tetratricopeptide (TPR) repeat protein
MPYFRKARALEGQKRISEALAFYDKAISIAPREYFYGSKALLLFRLGRYQEAIECDDKALERGTAKSGLNHLRWSALAKSGDLEQAAIEFEVSPTHKGTKTALPSALQTEQALAGYSEVIKLFPSDINMHYNRAIAYMCLGKAALAAADFEKVLKECNYPRTRLSACFFAFLVLKEAGQTSKAKEMLKVAESANISPMTAAITSYFKGKISEQALLSQPGDADDRARARCLIGINQIICGQTAQGKANLQLVVKLADSKLDEYSLAQNYLRRTGKGK